MAISSDPCPHHGHPGLAWVRARHGRGRRHPAGPSILACRTGGRVGRVLYETTTTTSACETVLEHPKLFPLLMSWVAVDANEDFRQVCVWALVCKRWKDFDPDPERDERRVSHFASIVAYGRCLIETPLTRSWEQAHDMYEIVHVRLHMEVHDLPDNFMYYRPSGCWDVHLLLVEHVATFSGLLTTFPQSPQTSKRVRLYLTCFGCENKIDRIYGGGHGCRKLFPHISRGRSAWTQTCVNRTLMKIISTTSTCVLPVCLGAHFVLASSHLAARPANGL